MSSDSEAKEYSAPSSSSGDGARPPAADAAVYFNHTGEVVVAYDNFCREHAKAVAGSPHTEVIPLGQLYVQFMGLLANVTKRQIGEVSEILDGERGAMLLRTAIPLCDLDRVIEPTTYPSFSKVRDQYGTERDVKDVRATYSAEVAAILCNPKFNASNIGQCQLLWSIAVMYRVTYEYAYAQLRLYAAFVKCIEESYDPIVITEIQQTVVLESIFPTYYTVAAFERHRKDTTPSISYVTVFQPDDKIYLPLSLKSKFVAKLHESLRVHAAISAVPVAPVETIAVVTRSDVARWLSTTECAAGLTETDLLTIASALMLDVRTRAPSAVAYHTFEELQHVMGMYTDDVDAYVSAIIIRALRERTPMRQRLNTLVKPEVGMRTPLERLNEAIERGELPMGLDAEQRAALINSIAAQDLEAARLQPIASEVMAGEVAVYTTQIGSSIRELGAYLRGHSVWNNAAVNQAHSLAMEEVISHMTSIVVGVVRATMSTPGYGAAALDTHYLNRNLPTSARILNGFRNVEQVARAQSVGLNKLLSSKP